MRRRSPGISNRGGRGNVIRTNTVEGWFDGLDAGNGLADENVAADSDYEGNVVTGCGDDGIETDTVVGHQPARLGQPSSRAFQRRCLAGADLPGPRVRPLQHHHRLPAQARSSSRCRAPATPGSATTRPARASRRTAAVWPSGPYSNMHFRNNILAGNGLPGVNDDAGESQTGNDFDGDLLYATGSHRPVPLEGRDYATLAALRAGTGFEAHGRPATRSSSRPPPATSASCRRAPLPTPARRCPAWTTATRARPPTSGRASSATPTA